MQIDIDSKTGEKTLKLLRAEQAAIEKAASVLTVFAVHSPADSEEFAYADAAAKSLARCFEHCRY